MFLSSPENPQFDPQALGNEPQALVPFVVDPLPPSDIQPTAPAPKAGENPVWSGWDVLQIAGLTLLTLFLSQLFIVMGARHFIFRHASWIDVAQKPSLALLSELLTYVVVALYMILLIEGKYHARFAQAIRWKWPGVAGASFLGVGVLMLAFDAMARFLPMPKSTPFQK